MADPKILILTYGTRGDVEPLLALALGLKRSGMSVAIATSTRYAGWIGERGIAALPVSDDLLAMMDTPDGRMLVEGGAGTVARIKTGLRMQKHAMPINVRMLFESAEAAEAFRPDLIVYHPKMFAGPHIAEKLAVPAVMAVFQPLFVPTAEFPLAGLPALPVPGWNRLSYRVVPLSMRYYRKHINTFRRERLGLGPVGAGWAVAMPPGAGRIPVLHAVSPHVIPRPADWPDHARLTGYWPLDPGTHFQPPAPLQAFLQAGPPPVYAGFGSMPSADPAALASLLSEAFRQAGVRGIIGAGWAGLDTTASDDIYVMPPVPHGWLFPQTAAIIHHGGAGTTAAAFRAGVPSVICPFIGDQPFWARRAHELGVAPPPLPRSKLTAAGLAASIREAVSNTAMRARADELGRKLKTETGVDNAVDVIAGLLPSA